VGEGLGEAARRMTVKRSNPAHFWEAKVLGRSFYQQAEIVLTLRPAGW